MKNKLKDMWMWFKEFTLIVISLILNAIIVTVYAIIIYPCQLLLVKINQKRYAKRETQSLLKECNETKRVIKINGTEIYQILYNKQRKGGEEK